MFFISSLRVHNPSLAYSHQEFLDAAPAIAMVLLCRKSLLPTAIYESSSRLV